MKKILLMVLCLFCLCGCGKQYYGYEINDLSAEPFTDDSYYINGTIKNINGTDCDTLSIRINLIGNGDVKDTKLITIDCPKKGEKEYLKEHIYTKLKNFKILIESVSLN